MIDTSIKESETSLTATNLALTNVTEIIVKVKSKADKDRKLFTDRLASNDDTFKKLRDYIN